MVKERFKFIAAAAIGAGAVLLASGSAAHLVALHSSGAPVRAQASNVQAQASPTPEVSPSPEASPNAVAPVTAPAAAPAPDDEATETVEDAQDANEAAEPAEVADPAEPADDVNDDDGAPVAAPPSLPAAEDHGHDGAGSGSEDGKSD